MNNNYHTQVDKQNMLNEVATNYQLIPQQVHNFPGTPINKNNTFKNSTFKNGTFSHNQIPYQTIPSQYQQTNDELELSELPDANPQIMNPPIINQLDKPKLSETNQKSTLPINDNVQKINNQIQKVFDDNNRADVNGNYQQNKNPTKPNLLLPSQLQSLPSQSQSLQSLQSLPPNTVTIQCPPKKSNIVVEYIVIPAMLVGIFVLLTHPKTSAYLRKYVPPMKNMKGFIIRGLILAIAYIIIRMIANTVTKN